MGMFLMICSASQQIKLSNITIDECFYNSTILMENAVEMFHIEFTIRHIHRRALQKPLCSTVYNNTRPTRQETADLNHFMWKVNNYPHCIGTLCEHNYTLRTVPKPLANTLCEELTCLHDPPSQGVASPAAYLWLTVWHIPFFVLLKISG